MDAKNETNEPKQPKQPKTPVVGTVDLDGTPANVHALPFGLARRIARMNRDQIDGYEIAELAIRELVRYPGGGVPEIDELSTAAVQRAVDAALGDGNADFQKRPGPSD